MTKKFRIDFTVRELDTPEDQARGITFGDDVPVEQIVDFFDKCRDVARTLFVTGVISRKPEKPELTPEERSKIISQDNQLKKYVHDMGYGNIYPGDDGSLGGTGPMSEQAYEWYMQHAKNLSKDRNTPPKPIVPNIHAAAARPPRDLGACAPLEFDIRKPEKY